MAEIDYQSLESIITGCVQKSTKAQEMLYKKYFGYALSVALLYSSNRDDAIETVDDSFLKVFAQIKRFNPSMSFKGWLRKIVINTAIDRIRKNLRHKSYGEELPVWVPDTNPGVISDLSATEIIAIVNNLPHIHKTVFCLYDIEGYSHEEISVRLNIPESSSRVYLTRAKKRLRELLDYNYKTKP